MRRPGGALLILLLILASSTTARSESTSGVIELEDYFATAVASGDFDGDGRKDLAIGVPEEDLGGEDNAGAVNVVYGSGGGLAEDGDEVWYQGTVGIAGGAEQGDRFGAALASGDFDGDGFDDLAVGVPSEDVQSGGAQNHAGAVNIVYGSDEGLTEVGDHLLLQEDAESNDNFGEALAAGDFDRDTRDDLAVGAPGEFIVHAGAGMVDVFNGSAAGLATSAAQSLRQGTDLSGNPEFADRFGGVLATGNLGGGAQDDLAIGVPSDEFDFDNEGTVHVVYGSGSGLEPDNSQHWHQDIEGISETTEATDYFGFSLAIGNFGFGQPADLAIGVQGESLDLDASELDFAGAVHVLYGTAEFGLTEDNDQFWHQSKRGVLDRIEAGDRFGYELTAADFGNSGKADLAIGVPFENLDGDPTNVSDAGIVQVLFGTTTGLTAAGDQRWHQDAQGIKNSAEDTDAWGLTLASGNFGAGTRSDLAVGVPDENFGGFVDAGAANVLYGTADGLSPAGDQFWHQASP